VKLLRLPTTEHQYLDHGQLHSLAEASEPYETLVLTLGYCGLRWGEAAALRVKRVDLLRGRLHIAEAMTEVSGHVILGVPKTHVSRSVPVPGFLRDALAVQCVGKAPDNFVFASPHGAILRNGKLRRTYFDPAARAVGLRGLAPHALRNTAASLAIAAGANVMAVQSLLGRASATTTLDGYSHLFGDQLDAVADAMDTAARTALGNVPRPARGLAVVALPATEAR
jgi:integrase